MVVYNREQRRSGESKWSLRRKLKAMADTVVAFSTTPIRFATLSGIALAFVGIAYGCFLAAYRLIKGPQAVSVNGWTTIVVLVLVLSGLQLGVIGMLGEYLWRALDDVRQRPCFWCRNWLAISGIASRVRSSTYACLFSRQQFLDPWWVEVDLGDFHPDHLLRAKMLGQVTLG